MANNKSAEVEEFDGEPLIRAFGKVMAQCMVVARKIENPDKRLAIFMGLGELKGKDGLVYQVQIVLEPEENQWLENDGMVTLRSNLIGGDEI